MAPASWTACVMCVDVYTHWVSTRRYRSETHTRVMQTRTRSREGSTASTGLLNGHRPWSATSTADSYMSMHTSTTGAASSMPAGPTVRARVWLPSVAEDTRAMPIGQAPAPAVMATQDVANNITSTAITLEVHVRSAMACGVCGKGRDAAQTQPNAKSKEIDVRPSQRKYTRQLVCGSRGRCKDNTSGTAAAAAGQCIPASSLSPRAALLECDALTM